MTSRRRPVTAAERDRRDRAQQEQLKALHERLAEQVRALRTGEDWRRWLDVARRLPNYSFSNVLLIAAQRPDATAVAGYGAWRSLGRQVNKGERGLRILAPVLRRPPARPDTDDQALGAAPPPAATGDAEPAQQSLWQLVGFRLAYVWDVSQTSGEPLPERPRPQLLQGQAPDGLWDALTRLAALRGFAVERGDCGSANGYTDFAVHVVRITPDVDDAQAVKTLAHELGHVLLHDPTDFAARATPGCRGVREVEAESVAYLVAGTAGVPSDSYTFPYVAGWASALVGVDPDQQVRDTGQRVVRAAAIVVAATSEPPAAAPVVVGELVAQAEAGQARAADVRVHAESTLAAVRRPSFVSAASADPAELVAVNRAAAAFFADQLHLETPAARQARECSPIGLSRRM